MQHSLADLDKYWNFHRKQLSNPNLTAEQRAMEESRADCINSLSLTVIKVFELQEKYNLN